MSRIPATFHRISARQLRRSTSYCGDVASEKRIGDASQSGVPSLEASGLLSTRGSKTLVGVVGTESVRSATSIPTRPPKSSEFVELCRLKLVGSELLVLVGVGRRLVSIATARWLRGRKAEVTSGSVRSMAGVAMTVVGVSAGLILGGKGLAD